MGDTACSHFHLENSFLNTQGLVLCQLDSMPTEHFQFTNTDAAKRIDLQHTLEHIQDVQGTQYVGIS